MAPRRAFAAGVEAPHSTAEIRANKIAFRFTQPSLAEDGEPAQSIVLAGALGRKLGCCALGKPHQQVAAVGRLIVHQSGSVAASGAARWIVVGPVGFSTGKRQVMANAGDSRVAGDQQGDGGVKSSSSSINPASA